MQEATNKKITHDRNGIFGIQNGWRELGGFGGESANQPHIVTQKRMIRTIRLPRKQLLQFDLQ
jgi:hypothetical protein